MSTAFGATKTATVNGTTLAYREQGDGDPVVFVHGHISDLRTWEQQLSAFADSYRAIAYSRRYARFALLRIHPSTKPTSKHFGSPRCSWPGS